MNFGKIVNSALECEKITEIRITEDRICVFCDGKAEGEKAKDITPLSSKGKEEVSEKKEKESLASGTDPHAPIEMEMEKKTKTSIPHTIAIEGYEKEIEKRKVEEKKMDKTIFEGVKLSEKVEKEIKKEEKLTGKDEVKLLREEVSRAINLAKDAKNLASEAKENSNKIFSKVLNIWKPVIAAAITGTTIAVVFNGLMLLHNTSDPWVRLLGTALTGSGTIAVTAIGYFLFNKK